MVAAPVRLNTPYGYERALHVLTEALRGYTRPAQRLSRDHEHTICSELFADAYSIATGLPLADKCGSEITPAFLSGATALEDVESRWLRMP